MLNWNPDMHALGVAEMDATHEEFARLASEVARAGDEDFPYLLAALIEHTQTHFENESRLMRACGFSAIAEHEGEHRRVLGEILHLRRGVDEGRLRFARHYVAYGLPDWFRNHLVTMDAALAACLNRFAIVHRQSGQHKPRIPDTVQPC
jgi:hemerythrin-like metal-binding protein